MLSVYISEEVRTKNDKTVNKIRKTEKICDDCWVNLIAPSDEEIENLIAFSREIKNKIKGVILVYVKSPNDDLFNNVILPLLDLPINN